MATPVLEAARRDPGIERLHVLVRSHLTEVLRGGPLERHVVPLESRAAERGVLAELDVEAVLLLSNSLGAAWRAFRARVPERAGAALAGRRPLLTHALRVPTRRGRRIPVPTARLQVDVAGLVGLTVVDGHPRLDFDDDARERVTRALSGAGLGRGEAYVLVAPGAAFGAAKLWPPERFAAVLDALHERRGLRAVATGGPGEEPLLRAVAAAASHPVVTTEGAGLGLHELKPLVADARLLLVGDSGPRWYAAAFDVPCVSVMGPNYPELTATSLELCRVLRVDGLECSPCLQRRCPLGHHRCLEDLPAERVLAAAEELLDRNS